MPSSGASLRLVQTGRGRLVSMFYRISLNFPNISSMEIFNSDCILALLRVQRNFLLFCDIQKQILNNGETGAKQPQFSYLCPWKVDDDSIAWAVAIRPELRLIVTGHDGLLRRILDSFSSTSIIRCLQLVGLSGRGLENLLLNSPIRREMQWSKLSSEDCANIYSLSRNYDVIAISQIM